MHCPGTPHSLSSSIPTAVTFWQCWDGTQGRLSKALPTEPHPQSLQAVIPKYMRKGHRG
jgi:hypothetical protein